MIRLKELWSRFQATRVWQAWSRYGNARGNVLAGGITYFAFLSLFPALALGFTLFGLFLNDRPELLADIQDYLRRTLPGFVQDENGNGLIPVTVPSATALSIAGLISAVGLLLTGLGWLSASRDAIRTIFGVPGSPGNLITTKLRDLLVMIGFGLGFVLSAAITVVANTATGKFAEAIGMKNQGWLVTGVGLVVGVVLDGGLIALMLRVLSGVPVPWRGVRNGAILGGVGLTLLKVLGAQLFAGSLDNTKVYGSIAVIAGLLIWLNLISRITLIAAALAANDLAQEPGVLGLSEGVQQKATEGPQELAVGAPPGSPAAVAAARAADGLPTFGQRSADRVTLATGAALGATAVAVLGTAVRAVRGLVRPNR